VQVDPIKAVLKAPGSVLLKLRYDGPLSNFAFRINSRRYSEVAPVGDRLVVFYSDEVVWLLTRDKGLGFRV